MDRVGNWGPVAVGAVLLIGACGDASDTTGAGAEGGEPAVTETSAAPERIEPSSAPTTDIGSATSPSSAVPDTRTDGSMSVDSAPRGATVLPDPSARTPPLLGTSWALTGATRDGQPVDVSSADRPPRWSFVADGSCTGCVGPMLEGSDGCNDVSWEISVDAASISLLERGMSTDALCTGELHDVMRAVFGGGSMAYAIDGDQLEVATADRDIVLEFTSLDALDDPFPATAATIVDAGEEGHIAYRLTWLGGWLGLELLNLTVPAVPSGSGFGMVMSPIYAERHDIGGRPYVVARMPAEVARAVYQPEGGPSIELALHDVAAPPARVVGEFIDDASTEWALVTYDGDGAELHRFVWPAVRVETPDE